MLELTSLVNRTFQIENQKHGPNPVASTLVCPYGIVSASKPTAEPVVTEIEGNKVSVNEGRINMSEMTYREFNTMRVDKSRIWDECITK